MTPKMLSYRDMIFLTDICLYVCGFLTVGGLHLLISAQKLSHSVGTMELHLSLHVNQSCDGNIGLSGCFQPWAGDVTARWCRVVKKCQNETDSACGETLFWFLFVCFPSN